MVFFTPLPPIGVRDIDRLMHDGDICLAEGHVGVSRGLPRHCQLDPD